MSKDNIFLFFYEPSNSSLMEVIQEEIQETQNLFQSEEETSLGKRKIIVKTEDEREVKRIAFFSQEPIEEEDIDMIEEDPKQDNHIDNELIMEDDCVLEEEYVVDFDGFF